ncbi:MAG TPA: hypothetical protein PKA63_05715 [Oligoflexia bacterium]|nr:hypothetical protein [Oligoflexia bacterium]HMP48147.1 hypothetical protein [Oligoflexia bacterium]
MINNFTLKLDYRTALIISVSLSTLIIFFNNLSRYEPYTYSYADPGWMMLTTISIAEDFDLDLRNQLDNNPARTGGQISIGKNGEWYPLHEPLLSFIGVPLYLLIGLNGTLLTNILLSLLISVLTFMLCAKYFSYLASVTGTVLTISTSLLLYYSYSFSVDVLGACLSLWAIVLLSDKKNYFAGIVYSFAVLGRNLNAVLLPAYLIFIAINNPKGKKLVPLFSFLISGIPAALVLAITNYVQFGSPFSLAWNSWVVFDENANSLISENHSFGRSIIDGLQILLLSPRQGIFTGMPLLPFGLLLGCPFLIKKTPQLFYFFLASFIALTLLFIPYESFPGEQGNRYFIMLAPLSAAFLAAAFDRMLLNNKI